MKLESLVLQGFKSFPDKTTVTFDSGLTAVVGPNGSGKSNISDAIRWVLGEQSSKTLRGEKMEDVVFAGSKQRKSQGYASVTLNLENKDRLLACDADLVSVTRKYYRHGDSEFSINGKPVRLKDVYELFMDTGLGRDGFSMIGQGRIEEIVSAKSTERRDLFETASGISKFRYHKEEAQRDLAKAEENLLRLNDILSELNARIEPLQKQSEKAKQFLELSRQKEQHDVFVSVSELNELKEQLNEQNVQIAACQKEYDEACRESNRLQFLLEQAYEQMQNDAVAIDESRNRRAKLEEELTEAVKAEAVSKNEMQHNLQEIERLQKESDQQNALLLMAQEKLATKQVLHSGLVEKLSLHQEKIADKKTQLQEISGRAKEQSESLQKLLADVAALQLKLTECEVRATSEKDNLSQDEKRKTQLEYQHTEHEKAWKLYQEEKVQANDALMLMQEKLSEQGNMIQGMQMRLQKREEKAKALTEAAQSLRLRKKGDEQQLSMLRSMEQNMEGYSGAVKAVLNAVKNRELSGIYGAVAQLINSKEAYTTAVETALGFTLQNIVVANEQTAKDAIRFLKQRDKGRATFMPLTSVKGNRFKPQRIEDETGYIGMADELVEYDQKFERIVHFLLGKIVVMDDIENASVTARKYQYKFRIVTLDGQVINAGGTYTGGSKAVTSSSLSRKNHIQTLQAEIMDYGRRLEELGIQQQNAEADLLQTKEEFSELQQEKVLLSEDIMRAQSECGRLDYTLAQEKQFLSSQKEELQKLDQRIQQRNVLLNDIDAAVLSLQNEMKQQKRLAAGADEQGDQLSRSQEFLSKEISELSLQELSVQKDITALEAEMKHLTQTQSSDEFVLNQKKQQIAGLQQKNEQFVEQQKLQAQEIKQNTLQKEQLLKKENKLIERRQQTEKKITDMRTQEKETSICCERCKQKTERVREQLTFKQQAYDEIIKHLYDEYEITRSEALERDFTGLSYQDSKQKLAAIKSNIKDLGSVNLSAIEEYEEVSGRKAMLDTQLSDIEQSKKTLNQLIIELTEKMEKRFVEGFKQINAHFGRIFTELFGGGSAHLSLTDPQDVLNCGIDIFVQPPGKVVKKISLLSGGEKSFIAIILYFALLSVKPSPFCVLDEIEAALDDVNVNRYAQYLHRMSDQTQFILITHRRGTMEQADCMYGVTMQEAGVSKLLKLDHAAMEADRKG